MHTTPSSQLVSIITPSFNQGDLIEATIRSVLDQDYPHIEYLVVDGGSRDGTLDVLRRYEGRLRWISEPDKGQSDAVNKGVQLTHGAMIGWLNSDDLYAPGAVARAVAEFNAHPESALVYGKGELIDRAGELIAPCTFIEAFDPQRLLNYDDIILQPAAFFRREPFLAVGGLDVDLHYSLDYDLWLKLGLRYPTRYIPELLAQARLYPETKTLSGGIGRMKEIEGMVRRHGRRRLPTAFYAEMVRTCRVGARQALAAGHWGELWTCLRSGTFYGMFRALQRLGYPI